MEAYRREVTCTKSTLSVQKGWLLKSGSLAPSSITPAPRFWFMLCLWPSPRYFYILSFCFPKCKSDWSESPLCSPLASKQRILSLLEDSLLVTFCSSTYKNTQISSFLNSINRWQLPCPQLCGKHTGNMSLGSSTLAAQNINWRCSVGTNTMEQSAHPSCSICHQLWEQNMHKHRQRVKGRGQSVTAAGMEFWVRARERTNMQERM